MAFNLPQRRTLEAFGYSLTFLLAPPSGQNIQLDRRNDRAEEYCHDIFCMHLFSLDDEPCPFSCLNNKSSVLHKLFKHLKARCSIVYLPQLIRPTSIKVVHLMRKTIAVCLCFYCVLFICMTYTHTPHKLFHLNGHVFLFSVDIQVDYYGTEYN